MIEAWQTSSTGSCTTKLKQLGCSDSLPQPSTGGSREQSDGAGPAGLCSAALLNVGRSAEEPPETRRDGADLRASDPTSCNGAAGIVATVSVAAAALSLASSASLWINRVTLDIAG